MNGDWFLAYVVKVLAPTLASGDIVVMDNLSSHKSDAVRAAIEAAGASLRFLPPYSPDLNPIEMAFAKLKAQLRKHAERSIETLWTRIGAHSSKASNQPNVAISSSTPDMLNINRKIL